MSNVHKVYGYILVYILFYFIFYFRSLYKNQIYFRIFIHNIWFQDLVLSDGHFILVLRMLQNTYLILIVFLLLLTNLQKKKY